MTNLPLFLYAEIRQFLWILHSHAESNNLYHHHCVSFEETNTPLKLN